jgi:predicted RNA-binding Zn-ribbon protein involved in translation (DUF1610 family)
MNFDRKLHAEQTHCNACGKKFERVRYECPVCGEWSCSDECRAKHKDTMDNI